jgi:small subunit ribosomal protein S5
MNKQEEKIEKETEKPVEEEKQKKEKVEEEKSEKSSEKKETEKKPVEEEKEKKEETKEEIKGDRKSPGRYKRREEEIDVSKWEPITKLGREVKDEKIKNIDEILDNKKKILESEIVDSLINVKSELINIGQSKGKFGGGKRRIWRQTQRKTKEGNIPTFSTLAVIGDEKGHVGIGSGKSKETLPAREKAIKKAKLNIIKIKRSCSGFDCSCPELHTIPLKVTGKCGSIRLTLIPASQGTGLVVGGELRKVLKLAGIKDVYSRTTGKKRTTINLVKACIDALKKASE